MESKNKQFIVICLVILSLLVAIAEAFFYWFDYPEPVLLIGVWTLVFAILVIMWIDIDSGQISKIYRPFDYKFLTYIFFPLYIPYYFISTRKLTGMIYLIVLLLLFNLGYVSQWIIYSVR